MKCEFSHLTKLVFDGHYRCLFKIYLMLVCLLNLKTSSCLLVANRYFERCYSCTFPGLYPPEFLFNPA
ncbi:hypothetical protein CS542_06130 [Pedobacter sp. IW39]|nr:hypothetical protein CS542_06130 [Pedobacter sp. IW39]